MRMFCSLDPSVGAVDFPDDIITSTHLAQTCMESTIGTVVSTQTTSTSSESTPQKAPPSSFDALVRENRSLIERVGLLILYLFAFNSLFIHFLSRTGYRFILFKRSSI
jgi:hypothetical protein